MRKEEKTRLLFAVAGAVLIGTLVGCFLWTLADMYYVKRPQIQEVLDNMRAAQRLEDVQTGLRGKQERDKWRK